jgi:hypothetical protein
MAALVLHHLLAVRQQRELAAVVAVRKLQEIKVLVALAVVVTAETFLLVFKELLIPVAVAAVAAAPSAAPALAAPVVLAWLSLGTKSRRQYGALCTSKRRHR